MRSRTVVWALIITLAAMAAGGSGCAAKKKGTAAPEEIKATLEATVKQIAEIASVGYQEPGPFKPGDTVTFTAAASVPEAHRIEIEVKGTSWRTELLPAAGAGKYGAVSTVPAGLAPGSYGFRARIVDATGREVRSRDGDRSLAVIAETAGIGAERKTPCAALQSDLEDLRVPFDYDKFELKEEAVRILASVAEKLRAGTQLFSELTIEGHCDERGTIEYNLALGQKRAAAVRGYLVDLGVTRKDLVKVISYGKERPRELGHDEIAWAANRRAEFKIACVTN